ncbi:hypothetical protein MES4922_300002 [Mesorhizobium ventifaucium]|uniref:Uncharacterized protein n=1 Tax=Mesorhizobium ventifaucium TaxID=666020 RepID=A0ABM9E135_9HYPH|nr:hypothetical protein MES4922_300002 [Mesorhizobium ventifaucium]
MRRNEPLHRFGRRNLPAREREELTLRRPLSGCHWTTALRLLLDIARDARKVASNLCVVNLSGEAANRSGALGDKFVAWHAAIRIARILRLKPVKEKHFEPAPMHGFDGASRLFGHPTGAAFDILEAVFWRERLHQ